MVIFITRYPSKASSAAGRPNCSKANRMAGTAAMIEPIARDKVQKKGQQPPRPGEIDAEKSQNNPYGNPGGQTEDRFYSHILVHTCRHGFEMSQGFFRIRKSGLQLPGKPRRLDQDEQDGEKDQKHVRKQAPDQGQHEVNQVHDFSGADIIG